jgi:hypothetical protein
LPFVLTVPPKGVLKYAEEGLHSLFYHRLASPAACFSALSAGGTVGQAVSEVRNMQENGQNALSAGF